MDTEILSLGAVLSCKALGNTLVRSVSANSQSQHSQEWGKLFSHWSIFHNTVMKIRYASHSRDQTKILIRTNLDKSFLLTRLEMCKCCRNVNISQVATAFSLNLSWQRRYSTLKYLYSVNFFLATCRHWRHFVIIVNHSF